MLDLIMEIDLESLPEVSKIGKLTVITQPGLRYAQAEAFIRQLLLDEQFQSISAVDRVWIAERILEEIRGRIAPQRSKMKPFYPYL